MPTFWAGTGGHAVAGSVTFSTIGWTLTATARLAETTHSGSAGVAHFTAGTKEYSGSAEIVWDSTAIPEVTIAVGTTVTLTFYVGGSTKTYSISAIIETVVPKVNARTEAVTLSFTWKGIGALTVPA